LDEDVMTYPELLDSAMNLITRKTASRAVSIDGAALRMALEKPSGIPVAISRRPVQPTFNRPVAPTMPEPDVYRNQPPTGL
jgi:L,D-transpeptidase ErfK/SrfK